MNLENTWQLFNRADGAGPWVIPLIMVLGGKLATWQRLNRVFIVHTTIAVAFAVIIVLFFKDENSAIRPFAFYRFGMLYASGFLLLTWYQQKYYARMIGLIGFLTYGFIAFLSLARHGLLTFLYTILIFLVIRQFQVKDMFRKIKGVYIYAFAVLLIVGMQIVTINYSEYVQNKTALLEKKLVQDSRSPVIKEFIDYVTNNPKLMLVGSGALGTYKTQLFLYVGITQRDNIENGYLQLVHKGGIIMLVLFLALSVPAAYMGIFFSLNWFTRITGFIVLGRLIDMFTYGLPWTDPSYMIFWLSVGACLNPCLRRMNNKDISLRSIN